MKRVQQTLSYPDTTVAEVFAMFTDPSYRTAVSVFQHVRRFSCDITPAGEGAEVQIEQVHGTDRIPSVAQRLLGDEIRFLQHESWASPAGAVVEVSVPGKPGEMRGTLSLRQDGPDVTEVVDMTVKVGVPLVGGTLEEMIAGFVGRVFTAQNTVGVGWLRGEREA